VKGENTLRYYREGNLTPHKSSFSIRIQIAKCLDDRSSRVRFPAGAGNFSLHRLFQNGSGAHPASSPMGTRGSFPVSKAARGVKLTTHLNLVPRFKNA
jgi:hypothetical protein